MTAARHSFGAQWLLRLARPAAAALGAMLALLLVLLAVLPRTGLYATFAVLSDSMAPAIPRGSIVVVRPAPVDRIRVGDVITFSSAQPPHDTLTHRVVGVANTGNGPSFRTKGDANQVSDPWQVQYNGFAGKVVLNLPAFGYLMVATTRPAVRFALAIGLPLLLGWLYLGAAWRRQAPPGAVPRAGPAAGPRPEQRISLVRVALVACAAIGALLISSGRTVR